MPLRLEGGLGAGIEVTEMLSPERSARGDASQHGESATPDQAARVSVSGAGELDMHANPVVRQPSPVAALRTPQKPQQAAATAVPGSAASEAILAQRSPGLSAWHAVRGWLQGGDVVRAPV